MPLDRGMPDDVVRELNLDGHSAVVALTHDPKLDDLALMEALKSKAFYVGALGSRANNDKRRDRLVEFDVTADEIARLHGPIGLYIGSRTPPEIAISILAEITAVKNGVPAEERINVAIAKAKLTASVFRATARLSSAAGTDRAPRWAPPPSKKAARCSRQARGSRSWRR